MAIPEGRLSTTLVQDTIAVPDNRKVFSVVNYEKGPYALEDTSQGLLYQDWTFEWRANSGEIYAIPETVGTESMILAVASLDYMTATFDQNARPTVSYSNSTSSYLWWYDSQIASRTTTDLGSDVISPTILLDDKRSTQSAANDMLLWYTKLNGATYDLYMLRQRDRFTIENLMGTGYSVPYIHNIGMHDGLRIQIEMKSFPPQYPPGYAYF